MNNNMNTKELMINGNKLLIVDAPIEATHSEHKIYDGSNFIIYRKSKVLGICCLDETENDIVLIKKYEGKVINIGAFKTTNNNQIAHLFNMVKNGNFWDYEYNGVFYPSAISALKDILDQEIDYVNPYIVIIKQS